MIKVDVPGHIMDEFKKMASVHSIESISVTDICERCSISRQTFYKYFNDKFQLLSQIYKLTITDIFVEIDENVPWDIVIGMMLAKMLEDREFYMSAVRYHGQNSLAELMLYHVYTSYVKEYTRRTGSEPDEDTLFELRFNAFGGTGCMLEWISDGMTTDPFVVASRVVGCMPPRMKTWFQRR